jgi:hypothetical protein
MMTIGIALAEQYDRAWEMLRATIRRFPAEAWRAGDAPGLVPARWALHATEAVDFYSRPTPDGFHWGGRFHVDQGAEAAALPDQPSLLEYMDEVQAALKSWLLTAPDAELMAGNAFPWTGDTVLQRMLYTLRHTMTHQGELSMLLRLRGADETEWR